MASLAFVAAGQFLILLAYLFAPDESTDAPIYERAFEHHWTDEVPKWWALSSLVAGILAIVGLIADRRREVAAIALVAAFLGFAWPWG